MTRKPIREAAIGLALLLITLVAMGGALEASVRFFLDDGMQFNLEMWKYARDIKQVSVDPLIGHEHQPLTHSHLMGVDVAINSLGLREREIPLARTPGTARILMLGDSFTFGWGVAFEETISKRLERMFAKEGRNVEVINSGVGNYNTSMEVEYFLTRGLQFHPDIVVLNYVINDAEPEPGYGANGIIGRHSALYVVFKGTIDSITRRFGAQKRWDEYYLDLYSGPGWEAAKSAMGKLAEAARQQNIKLIVVAWPELHDVRNYRLGRITELVRAVAEAENVPFVDLLPAVKDQESSKLWVTPPDPHPNGYGNGLFADYLFPILKPLLPAP